MSTPNQSKTRTRLPILVVVLLLLAVSALLQAFEPTPALAEQLPARVTPRVIDPNDYATLPSDFPPIEIITGTGNVADGYLFVSTFSIDWSTRSFANSNPYLLILDNNGEPVFFRRMSGVLPRLDFKKQPNGLLSYTQWGGTNSTSLNNSYEEVRKYEAGNGRNFDIHDFLILPNGNTALMIYEITQVDMSQLVAGGNPAANVVELILQEVTPDGDVVFEWKSLDHIPITDSTADLTAETIDYIHGNSIEVAPDGNWIISSRYTDEITKIDRSTGDVMWRLGGKGNEFTFVPDTVDPFFDQHDARITADGTLTLFDNHNEAGSTYARAVEYQLDEVNKVATQVWEYRQNVEDGSRAMGSTRRLDNGNTIIGWGSMYPSVTEVEPDGTVALEMSFGEHDDPNVIRNSYRVFRDTWVGNPTQPPALVSKQTPADEVGLYFSWNGATEVISYNVYAGSTLADLSLLTTVPKDGFETTMTVAALGSNCFFQIEPVLPNGVLGLRSNKVIAQPCVVSQSLLPIVFGTP